MQNEVLSGSSLHPQIRLLSFRWDHEEKVEQIDFSPGFNIIGDRTQTERTVLLRLIRYAMGGSHSRIDNEIMNSTKRLQLELMANGQHIVMSRGFEHSSGTFPVLIEGQPERNLNPRDLGEFFLEILGLPKVYYDRNQSRTLLSFNDLARSFVIDRDFSYTDILAQMYPEPRKEVVKLMLGLTTQEIADIEEEIRTAENKIQRLTEEIRGIERLLSDFQIGSLIEIENRRTGLKSLPDKFLEQENGLRQTIEQAASQKTVVANYRGDEYQSLRNELIESRKRADVVENELAVLRKQSLEKSELKSLLEAEADRVERHTSSQSILSTFTFSRCPRCLQPITPVMRNQELDGDCMLCGRPLRKNINLILGH
ncbi:MAG: hypothetical protein PHQ40_07730 [Anaerolineaceae bacterium]|nr:hypothetical protein [Anaerolineaceae bacterium]